MRTLLTLTAMLGLVGCVGGVENEGPEGPNPPPPPPDGKMGKAIFDQDVYPVTAAKCMSCHREGATAGGAPASSGFVAATAAEGYDTMLEYPNVHGNFSASAKLLTYVTIQSHQNITYTEDEIGKIENWLSTELAERADGGPGPTPPPDGPGATTERLLAQFSGCMTQANFDAANMAQACGDLETNAGAECDNCHHNNGFNFTASRLSAPFFERMSTQRGTLQDYYMVAGAENPATAAMALNLPLFEAVLSGTGRYFQHERVTNNGQTPSNNTCTQAMQAFYDLTMQAMQAAGGNCGPSKLVN